MTRAPSKWRRRAAALLAAVAMALALLKVPAVRLAVARTAAGVIGARHGTAIAMQGADWSLWPLGASADGVVVQMEGMTTRVQRIEVTLSGSRRWRVRLVRPALELLR